MSPMSEELGESIKHTLQFLSTNLLPVIPLKKLIDYTYIIHNPSF